VLGGGNARGGELAPTERLSVPASSRGHLSNAQVLLAYFKGVPLERCVDLEMPMSTLVEFTPHQVRDGRVTV
jgi:hypothetical protein